MHLKANGKNVQHNAPRGGRNQISTLLFPWFGGRWLCFCFVFVLVVCFSVVVFFGFGLIGWLYDLFFCFGWLVLCLFLRVWFVLFPVLFRCFLQCVVFVLLLCDLCELFLCVFFCVCL